MRAIVSEVVVAPHHRAPRYEKPPEEVLAALKQSLFSSLPPEDYLKRKAAAEMLRLSTECPVEPVKEITQE
eukprot:6483588-Amphidinium_carterae.1